MRRTFFVVFIFAAIAAFAQSVADVEDYIAKYASIALQNQQDYGIPAPITLAQGILESGAGKSKLTVNTNNHFGIKAMGKWSANRVYYAWDDEATKSRFRCYNSAAESYDDHAKLLVNNPRYRDLFSINIYDYRRWAHGLKKAGYATAPNYASALIGIIDQYALYNINGGVKLRPGRVVTVTKYVESQDSVVSAECELPVNEITEEQELVINVAKRYVVSINECRCTTLQPGETLSSIARRYNISVAKLLRYNEASNPDMFAEGDVVFLEKKKKRFDGPQDYYIAKANETLYSVSQQFGIRLFDLAELNSVGAFVMLSEGDRVLLK